MRLLPALSTTAPHIRLPHFYVHFIHGYTHCHCTSATSHPACLTPRAPARHHVNTRFLRRLLHLPFPQHHALHSHAWWLLPRYTAPVSPPFAAMLLNAYAALGATDEHYLALPSVTAGGYARLFSWRGRFKARARLRRNATPRASRGYPAPTYRFHVAHDIQTPPC